MHKRSAGEAGWHCWRQEAVPHLMDTVVAAAAGSSVPCAALGKAWNEPVTPAQAKNPQRDLDPALHRDSH